MHICYSAVVCEDLVCERTNPNNKHLYIVLLSFDGFIRKCLVMKMLQTP